MLLLVGVFSLLERVLLAAVQYRQGPTSVLLNGATQIIADGLKIYGKYAVDTLIRSAGLFTVGLVFGMTVGLALAILCGSLLTVNLTEADTLLGIVLLSLLGSATLILIGIGPNSYTYIGVLRHIKAMIIAEICLESCIVFMIWTSSILDTGSDTASSRFLESHVTGSTLIFAWISISILSGRSPFDLPEAESEIIAGILTELGGSSFSLGILVETTELIFQFCSLANMITALASNILFVLGLLNLSYIGRLILVRIQMGDLYRLVFSTLLWLIGSNGNLAFLNI